MKFIIIALLLTLLSLPSVKAQTDKTPYTSNIPSETEAPSQTNLREADVFWRKRVHRVIDVREKMNLPFAFPRKTFFEVVLNAAQEQHLTLYTVDNEYFEEQLPYDSLQQQLTPEKCYYDAYLDTTVCAPAPLDFATITKYRVMEDWIWDEANQKMVVRIMGIAPVRDVIDPLTGESRGEEYLCWIFYPEARAALAKSRAFNPQNDALRYTWEEIFEARMFSSYVVKESNVLDKSIEEYATGVRAILESKRIEDKLFKMEHEMWEH